MKIELKKKVVYEAFDTKIKLQERILSMILKSNTNKILYKGDPSDIDYKLMKKVLLDDYTQKIDPEIVKERYISIVESTDNREFCLIYKS